MNGPAVEELGVYNWNTEVDQKFVTEDDVMRNSALLLVDIAGGGVRLLAYPGNAGVRSPRKARTFKPTFLTVRRTDSFHWLDNRALLAHPDHGQAHARVLGGIQIRRDTRMAQVSQPADPSTHSGVKEYGCYGLSNPPRRPNPTVGLKRTSPELQPQTRAFRGAFFG